jgi:hypothetical protein
MFLQKFVFAYYYQNILFDVYEIEIFDRVAFKVHYIFKVNNS